MTGAATGKRVFTPEQAHILTAAFDRAWKSVSFAFDSSSEPGAINVRRQIADAIMDRAKAGDIDERALTQYAIGRLPPLEAKWSRAERQARL